MSATYQLVSLLRLSLFFNVFAIFLIFFLTQVRHHRLLSLALPKGWLPQLVLLQDESFEEANLSVIVNLQYYIELKYIISYTYSLRYHEVTIPTLCCQDFIDVVDVVPWSTSPSLFFVFFGNIYLFNYYILENRRNLHIYLLSYRTRTLFSYLSSGFEKTEAIYISILDLWT